MIKEVPFRQNEFNSMTEFAMSGIDFRPITVGNEEDADFSPALDDECYIHSGSIRSAEAHSDALGTEVYVDEIYIIGSRGASGQGTRWSHHRIIIEYDDRDEWDEVCLDRGTFCMHKNERRSFDEPTATIRVMKALGAIAERRLQLG